MLNSKISIKLLKLETHIRLLKGAHISQISEKQHITMSSTYKITI